MNNPRAFPCVVPPGPDYDISPGMTLRDYMAAAALQGLLAADDMFANPEQQARKAYEYADQMLRSRAGGSSNEDSVLASKDSVLARIAAIEADWQQHLTSDMDAMVGVAKALEDLK